MAAWRVVEARRQLRACYIQRLICNNSDGSYEPRYRSGTRRRGTANERQTRGTVFDLQPPGSNFTALFPLDSRRWLSGDVVDHARDSINLIHDAPGDEFQKLIRQTRPMSRHEVDRLNGP
jgi:hypothetical protein